MPSTRRLDESKSQSVPFKERKCETKDLLETIVDFFTETARQVESERSGNGYVEIGAFIEKHGNYHGRSSMAERPIDPPTKKLSRKTGLLVSPTRRNRAPATWHLHQCEQGPRTMQSKEDHSDKTALPPQRQHKPSKLTKLCLQTQPQQQASIIQRPCRRGRRRGQQGDP